jgi:REP element-mobilizing transposase RayT
MKSLSNLENAQIVEDAISFYSGQKYEVDAYVIMPDHIHLLITPFEGFDLDKILFCMKNYSGKSISKVHKTKGRFWQPDHFDHIVRNLGYWIKYFDYIHNNPVKANIVNTPIEYNWSSLSKLYTGT